MVAAGEDVSLTLKREFSEETMNSLEMPASELREIKRRVRETFKNGQEVCMTGGGKGVAVIVNSNAKELPNRLSPQRRVC